MGHIIEHIGPNLHCGHYISYFKKNNTWYCANDKVITMIGTEDLPSQPYINIYKEAHSVSQSTDAENVATFGSLSTEENNLPGNKHRQDKPNEENVLACGDNCTNEDFDTVLETFYQKTDQGNGVSDIIAEKILIQEQPNYNRRVVVAPTEKGKFVNYEEVKDIEE